MTPIDGLTREQILALKPGRELDVLDEHTGSVLLSGYANPIYNERLKHWHRETKITTTEAAKYAEEVLWLNPVAAEQQRQLTLF